MRRLVWTPAKMWIEEPSEPRLNIQGEAHDSSTPEHEAEVAQLQLLARQLEQLEPARLAPQARERMAARLRRQAAADGGSAPAEDSAEDSTGYPVPRLYRQLAKRLGVSIDDLRRYVGPRVAVMVGRFLGVPGYNAMFDLLGLLLRARRRFDSMGSIH